MFPFAKEASAVHKETISLYLNLNIGVFISQKCAALNVRLLLLQIFVTAAPIFSSPTTSNNSFLDFSVKSFGFFSDFLGFLDDFFWISRGYFLDFLVIFLDSSAFCISQIWSTVFLLTVFLREGRSQKARRAAT